MSDKSVHTASATFTFKNQASKTKFIEFCNGDDGLSVTRAWPGCISIECYEKHDNVLAMIIWQKWDNKESHESYVKYRHDNGSFNFLKELVSCVPDIASLNPVNFMQ